MTVSVVICCYTTDRWSDVVRGLASLADQRRAPDQVVVVVDHNEELLEMVREHVAGHPLPVDVVANAGSRGLSGARNTGVAESRGDVVAFLDDDACAADRSWVSGLLAPYHDPSVWGVGGAADPDWGGPGPGWFPDEFGWVVGCSYRGQPESPAAVRNFLGCNMSFRRRAFDEVGGFTEGIGRVGTTPVGCEETEFCIRLRQAHPDARLIYDPRVRVRHRVSPDRHRFGYFRARCTAEGRSKAQVTDEVGTSDGLSSERSYALVVLPGAVLRGAGRLLRGDLDGGRRAAAVVLGLVWTTWGYAAARVRQVAGARRRP